MTSVIVHRFGSNQIIPEDEFLAYIDAGIGKNPTPFSDEALNVLRILSKKLLTSTFCKDFPQLTSLGYWLRPAAIEILKKNFLRSAESRTNRFKVARGLAFHLPPANVDTLFAYSWVLSFLAGNRNITRMPTEINNVATWLCEVIQESLEEFGLSDHHVFCSYDKTDDLLRSLSSRADLRVIWGGNEKVFAVSSYNVQPDGLSIGFPDRKSICCVYASAYKAADSTCKRKLASRFYNDLFWFDQMGCGSPRLLVWIGDSEGLSEEFTEYLLDVIKEKKYVIPTGINIGKFVASNNMLADGSVNVVHRHGSQLTLLTAPKLGASLLDQSHGGGYLIQVVISSLTELEKLKRKDLQTITTFGFSTEKKLELAKIFNGCGGYRIVEVGEALHFDAIWDGIDLLEHFTRSIVVHTP